MYHLFSDLKGRYLYDSNKNKAIRISEGLYNYLKKVDNSQPIDECTLKEYNDLKEEGYFKQIVTKIANPARKTFIYLLERSISNLVLQVTQDCNFRCIYCPYCNNDGTHRKHSKKYMTKEKAKKAIDFLHAHSIDSNSIAIGFYGGEPLLNFELIKYVVEYASEVFEGKLLTFNMTTNATLFTEEILDFVEKYNFSIMISLDGPSEINDRNRHFANSNKSTFKVVKEKLLLIKEKYPSIFKLLTINVVMNPSDDFYKIQEIYDELPFLKDICVRATIVEDYGLSEKNVYKEAFISGYEYFQFLNAIDKLSRINSNKYSNILEYYLQIEDDTLKRLKEQVWISDVSYPAGACIPGYQRLFIDVDGTFYSCEKLSETANAFKIGNLSDGFNIDKCLNLLEVAKLTSDECKKCWCFRLCSSCVKYAVENGELSRKKRLEFCEYSMNQAEHYLLKQVAKDNLLK